ARVAGETLLADLIAAAVTLHPEAYADIAGEPFASASADLRLRLLAAVTGCVGGRDWPPREERVARLEARIRAGGFRQGTLGGCLVRTVRHGLLVCREPTEMPLRAIAPGAAIDWDGRFRIHLSAGAPDGLSVGPVGHGAVARLRRRAAAPLPASVFAALPALYDRGGLVTVPHLGPGGHVAERDDAPGVAAVFRPRRPLLGPAFALV
ncbi:MAG: hypothetical protein ACK4QW_08250, partial [Alphaproteobacteria bacterium]